MLLLTDALGCQPSNAAEKTQSKLTIWWLTGVRYLNVTQSRQSVKDGLRVCHSRNAVTFLQTTPPDDQPVPRPGQCAIVETLVVEHLRHLYASS
jgi:hypothetical protein